MNAIAEWQIKEWGQLRIEWNFQQVECAMRTSPPSTRLVHVNARTTQSRQHHTRNGTVAHGTAEQ